jgi:hypothetical protein
MRTALGHQYQLLGVFDGKRPQQDLVNERENRCIRANPERNGHNRHDREQGRSQETAAGIAEIPKDVRHER